MQEKYVDITVLYRTEQERKEKQHDLKQRIIEVDGVNLEGLLYGIRKNYPTLLSFVPPKTIQDDNKTMIYILEPDDLFPRGFVHLFIEVDFLDKDISIEMDLELVYALNNSRMVNVRSDYSCCFMSRLASR